MPRALWKLRGQNLLVVSAWLPSYWELHEGQVRQRLGDGGGEAQGVPWMGGDPETQVQLLQAPNRARSGLLRNVAQFLWPQSADGLLRHPRSGLQPDIARHRRLRPPLLRERSQHQDWKAKGEVPLHFPLVLLRQLSGVRAGVWRAHVQIKKTAFHFTSPKLKTSAGRKRVRDSEGLSLMTFPDLVDHQRRLQIWAKDLSWTDAGREHCQLTDKHHIGDLRVCVCVSVYVWMFCWD